MKDTSISAYRECAGVFATQRERIFDYLKKVPDATRREIATALKLDVSAVSGRVNEMIADLEELPRRKCKITGIMAHPVRIAELKRNQLVRIKESYGTIQYKTSTGEYMVALYPSNTLVVFPREEIHIYKRGG